MPVSLDNATAEDTTLREREGEATDLDYNPFRRKKETTPTPTIILTPPDDDAPGAHTVPIATELDETSPSYDLSHSSTALDPKIDREQKQESKEQASTFHRGAGRLGKGEEGLGRRQRGPLALFRRNDYSGRTDEEKILAGLMQRDHTFPTPRSDAIWEQWLRFVKPRNKRGLKSALARIGVSFAATAPFDVTESTRTDRIAIHCFARDNKSNKGISRRGLGKLKGSRLTFE